jgi:transcriptional regulator with XRE-family HTH domain
VTEPRYQTPPAGKRAFGAALVYFRERAGITQAELARRSGVDAATILALERGESEPHWGTARKLAAGLGVPLDALAAEAERREAAETR